MEGVTFSCYEAFCILIEAGAQPRGIVLAGGGARSLLWQQIVADVFTLPVQRLVVSEQSAQGAALLAGAGIGLFDPAAASQEWARYDPPVEPNLEHNSRYQEILEMFRAAYQKHRDDFWKLAALTA
jgi:xylulokinase